MYVHHPVMHSTGRGLKFPCSGFWKQNSWNNWILSTWSRAAFPMAWWNPLFPSHVLARVHVLTHYNLITEMSNSSSIRTDCSHTQYTHIHRAVDTRNHSESAIGDLFYMTLDARKKKKCPQTACTHTHIHTHTHGWNMSLSQLLWTQTHTCNLSQEIMMTTNGSHW